MPAVLRPFVLPTSINFYCNDESTLTQRVTVYNPYNFDILYKVDNAWPQKYNISIRQGVISSRQKLHLDVHCRRKELSLDDTIQVRFFKWPRPCHGTKPRAQQYIGYREIRLSVFSDQSERELTPSRCSDQDMSVDMASASVAGSKDASPFGFSGRPLYQHHQYQQQQQQYLATGDRHSSLDGASTGGQHARTKKLQVLMDLGVTIVLLALGFLLSKADEVWFSANVLEGAKPHTIAVVFYTLAVVLIIKLMTFR